MSRAKQRLFGPGVLLIVIAETSMAQCELQKLTASDGTEGDHFGCSVAISEDHVLVGARRNDAGVYSGSAYVFRRDGALWEETAKLMANDVEPGDDFGYRVSISEDCAVVGARFDDDACPADPHCNSGAAYVFRLQGGSWSEEAKLVASDAAANDWFGDSLAANGNCIAVGAWYDDGGGEKSGSVYIFRHTGTTWIQEAKLTASDAEPGDRFGNRVSLNGEYAVVGAWLNDDACPDDPDCNSGCAYVFHHVGSTWVEEQKLLGADTAEGDNFGISVAISGDYVIVGARYDDDACAPDYPWNCASGSAYIFKHEGSTWVEVAKVTASDAAYADMFGRTVSINGQYALVGAPGAMSAYVFRQDDERWVQWAKVGPPAPKAFGSAVAMRGNIAIVGATGDSHAGTFSGAARAYSVTGCADIPALSEWGLLVLMFLLLAASTLILRRRRVGEA